MSFNLRDNQQPHLTIVSHEVFPIYEFLVLSFGMLQTGDVRTGEGAAGFCLLRPVVTHIIDTFGLQDLER